MKKQKEFKQLGVGEKLKLSEMLGSKVAIIMNKAREKCNKLLQPIGYGVNINVDFYRLDEQVKDTIKKDTEVANG